MKTNICAARMSTFAIVLGTLIWSSDIQCATNNLITETFNNATVGTLAVAAAPNGIPGADLTTAPYSAGWTFAQQGGTVTGTKAVADLGGGNRVVQVSGRASAGEVDQFFTNEGGGTRPWSSFETLELKCRLLFLETTTGQANNDLRLIVSSSTTTPNGPGFQINGDTTPTGGYVFRVGMYITGTGNFVTPAPTVTGSVTANKVYEVTTSFTNGTGTTTDITYQVANLTDGGNLVAPGSANVAAQLGAAVNLTFTYARVANRMNGWFDEVVLNNITSTAGMDDWRSF